MKGETVHVVPLCDLKPHVEAGLYCHCRPRVDGSVVIHNAYDGREFFEEEDGIDEITETFP